MLQAINKTVATPQSCPESIQTLASKHWQTSLKHACSHYTHPPNRTHSIQKQSESPGTFVKCVMTTLMTLQKQKQILLEQWQLQNQSINGHPRNPQHHDVQNYQELNTYTVCNTYAIPQTCVYGYGYNTSVRLGRYSGRSRAFQSIWNTPEHSEHLPSFTDVLTHTCRYDTDLYPHLWVQVVKYP